jgi:lysophospholipase L1-like esterase
VIVQGMFPVVLAGMVAGGAMAANEAAPWENEIRAFEVRDRSNPPPRNGIVFVGSSSIAMWDLAASFPGLPVINRGFGGSQLADSTMYAGRIVIPYHPRTVVLYAGDNDIAAGKTPEQVAADFAGFLKVVRAGLPDAWILFLSIKPCPQRWALYDRVKKANKLIRAQARKARHVHYVDVGTALLGKDGLPRPELYQADGLHLSAEGYMFWSSIVALELK